MKRSVILAFLFGLALAGAACLPAPTTAPANGTPQAGTADGSRQGQRLMLTPGAIETARASGQTGPGGGLSGRPSGTPTPEANAATVTPAAPTRTPAPSPTSVAARFFWTPTPAPAPAPPAPRQPLQGRIVYQTSSGGDIVVVNPDGSGARTVARGLDPAWSPDGRQIAFTKWVDGPGLYVINADGSGEKRLYELNDAKSPAWSPDGKMIVVTTRDSRMSTFTAGNKPVTVQQDTWMLVAIPVAGGDPVPVPVDGEYYAFDPTWSSRGPIVYRGSRGLYITSMDPGTLATVLGKTPRPDSPAWSPDGSKLAFMMWQNDHWDIFTMDPDGSGLRILTPPPPFLTRVPNNVAPAWSPDGRSIVFLSDRAGLDQWGVYAMNADGSDQRKIMDATITYTANSERVFSWTR